MVNLSGFEGPLGGDGPIDEEEEEEVSPPPKKRKERDETVNREAAPPRRQDNNCEIPAWYASRALVTLKTRGPCNLASLHPALMASAPPYVADANQPTLSMLQRVLQAAEERSLAEQLMQVAALNRAFDRSRRRASSCRSSSTPTDQQLFELVEDVALDLDVDKLVFLKWHVAPSGSWELQSTSKDVKQCANR